MALEFLELENELRSYSLKRAEELKQHIEPYLKKKAELPTGFDLADFYAAQKERILHYFKASQEDWDDWRWQMRHRITDVDTLSNIFSLTPQQKEEITTVGKTYRWAVSPYYLSLMDFNNPNDPIVLQGIPNIKELQDEQGEADPMGKPLLPRLLVSPDVIRTA